ncbi:hypothetical protein GIB67_003890 [Kingdonia uniflora]|uniref:Uncharacterized protein n=1 Tax=Kingdonia uniflora TaxID=39325 RepID=A0A7J7LK78_9MAGN|nr:hypothetical protein GIB67_003890 [Kingdonia uniflora]
MALMNGTLIDVFAMHGEAAQFPTLAPDFNGYKGARDIIKDDTITIHDRKVGLAGWHLSQNKMLFFSGALLTLAVDLISSIDFNLNSNLIHGFNFSPLSEIRLENFVTYGSCSPRMLIYLLLYLMYIAANIGGWKLISKYFGHVFGVWVGGGGIAYLEYCSDEKLEISYWFDGFGATVEENRVLRAAAYLNLTAMDVHLII